jgi:hypothetical protein
MVGGGGGGEFVAGGVGKDQLDASYPSSRHVRFVFLPIVPLGAAQSTA